MVRLYMVLKGGGMGYAGTHTLEDAEALRAVYATHGLETVVVRQ